MSQISATGGEASGGKKWSAEQSDDSTFLEIHLLLYKNLEKTLFWIFNRTLWSEGKCVLCGCGG